jgi:hypothetical protein
MKCKLLPILIADLCRPLAIRFPRKYAKKAHLQWILYHEPRQRASSRQRAAGSARPIMIRRRFEASAVTASACCAVSGANSSDRNQCPCRHIPATGVRPGQSKCWSKRHGCLDALEDEDLPITLEMAHKVSVSNDGYPDGMEEISRPTSNDDPFLQIAQVVGGTAFFFSRDENVQCFDWLFVDEAAGLYRMSELYPWLAESRRGKLAAKVDAARAWFEASQGAQRINARISLGEIKFRKTA